MAKYTDGEAIRMVGHLLEHNGIVGPFYADKDGNSVHGYDPEACKFCLAGAIDKVSETLGVSKTAINTKVCGMLGRGVGRVLIWEADLKNPYKPSSSIQRLMVARKLQNYTDK